MEFTNEFIENMAANIFNESNNICCDACTYINMNNHYDESDINVSDIATRLIQETGRWVEHWASDFIITWDTVRKCINEHMKTTDILPTKVFFFGLRSNGVDHTEYIASNLYGDTGLNPYLYRKVFAVQVMDVTDDDTDKRVLVTLKDVTSRIVSETMRIRNERMFVKPQTNESTESAKKTDGEYLSALSKAVHDILENEKPAEDSDDDEITDFFDTVHHMRDALENIGRYDY